MNKTQGKEPPTSVISDPPTNDKDLNSKSRKNRSYRRRPKEVRELEKKREGNKKQCSTFRRFASNRFPKKDI